MSLINICSHERLEVIPIKHKQGTLTDFQVMVYRGDKPTSVLFVNQFEVRAIDDEEDQHGNDRGE